MGVLGGWAFSYERGTPVINKLSWVPDDAWESCFAHCAPIAPGQWLQCQANGSNVCRVLRPLWIITAAITALPPSISAKTRRMAAFIPTSSIYEDLGQLGQDEPASG